MLKQIVAHSNVTVNVNPFDELTDDDRHEFEAWIDECKAEVREPQPEDFDGMYAEQVADDRFKDEASQPEWETLKANTYARMVANGQLDPDMCAEVDKPFEEWLDSLPDDCHSDPMDLTYSDAADFLIDTDFPIDDDLATTLDEVYGKGNWQAKNYLVIRHNGVWQDTDYWVKQFVSGKYFIDDETRNSGVQP